MSTPTDGAMKAVDCIDESRCNVIENWDEAARIIDREAVLPAVRELVDDLRSIRETLSVARRGLEGEFAATRLTITGASAMGRVQWADSYIGTVLLKWEGKS